MSLCVPGAKPTQLALKRLMAEAPVLPQEGRDGAPTVPGGRDVRVLAVELLTGHGSKDVRHVAVDLLESGLTYAPGELAEHRRPKRSGPGGRPPSPLRQLQRRHGARGTYQRPRHRPSARPDPRPARRRRSASTTGGRPACTCPRRDRRRTRRCRPSRLLHAFPSARPPLADLLRSLPPLRPRLHSIASSQRVTPREAHLCVAGCATRGAAGCATAWRAAFSPTAPRPTGRSAPLSRPATSACPPIPHAHHHVRTRHRHRTVPRLPAGARGAGNQGRAWLLFGERQRAHDFLYEADLRRGSPTARCRASMSPSRAIRRARTTCSTAWSRMPLTCGAGCRTARISTSAAMRPAWRATSMRVAPHRDDRGQARRGPGARLDLALARQGRYQRDIY